MRLTREQSYAALEKFGCYVTEVCDKGHKNAVAGRNRRALGAPWGRGCLCWTIIHLTQILV